jgi:hypothetical protein
MTVYALRAFRYKKDGKVYNIGKPVEIDDKEVESYIKRKLVTKEKPAVAKDTKDEKGDKEKK